MLIYQQFQSTFPHGERPCRYGTGTDFSCFNPRSRTGNDPIPGVDEINSSGFQSTFPHGERREFQAEGPMISGFNPRSRTGNDVDEMVHGRGQKRVSIHVPARGTTSHLHQTADTQKQFQSTFPHGERQPRKYTTFRAFTFQSTFPHGERLITSVAPIGIQFCFNPRSRTGNDSIDILDGDLDGVSIHVPVRGTT